MNSKLIRLAALCGLLFIAGIASAFAQTGTIKGTVIDSTTSKPLPGVNIGIKSTGRGAATDGKGHYEIDDIPAGTYKLTASFVGYGAEIRTVKINSGAIKTINFELSPTTQKLSQVVVTALGLKTKERSLGYSVQQIGGEKIEDSPEIGLLSSLAGMTSGLQISNSNGQPGSSTHIVIRGSNSITGNNQPLFVVDGIPINNNNAGTPGVGTLQGGSASNRVLDIDPSIIKNVSILKGGAASALYGSRAANGVVLITTKNGHQGKMRVNFSSKIRLDKAILKGTQDEYLSGLNGYFANGLPANRGGYIDPKAASSNPEVTQSWGPRKNNVPQRVLDDLGVERIKTYNHLDDFYQRGITSTNSLSFSGGNKSESYFLSASRLNQKGTVPSTSLDRTNLNLKVRKELLPKNLISTTRINYINTANNWMRNGFRSATRLTRLWPINLKMKPYQYEDGFNRTLGKGADSPFWQVNETTLKSNVKRVLLKETLIYDILPWLEINGRFGLDSHNNFQQVRRNKRKRFKKSGSMREKDINQQRINSDAILQAKKRKISKYLGISALLGAHIETRDANNNTVAGNDQNIPGFYDDSNFNNINGYRFSSTYHLMSLYSRVRLDYEDYLYLTLTGRNDWSSTLPKNNRSYFYPSASLGFIFTDLFKLNEDSPLDFGKIRASISKTGSDAPIYSLKTNYISPSFIANFQAGGRQQTLRFPFRGTNGFLKSKKLGNPNLKPEITSTYEVGLNLGFFDDRFLFDATYYNAVTDDQIYATPVSPALGFNTTLRNAGKIRNKGVELTISGTPINTKDIQWKFTANWSRNRSEVVSLAPGVNRLHLGGYTRNGIEATVGEGYGIIRGLGYKRNDQGQYIIQDDPSANNYGWPIRENQRKTIGHVQPTWKGNLSTTFRYKGIFVSGLLDIQQGGDVFNFDLNYTIKNGMAKMTEQRGTQITDPDKKGYVKPFIWKGVKKSNSEANDIKLVRNRDYWLRYANTSENFVEDGSYIKLRQVSLGYQVPRQILAKTPLRAASFAVSARNLWIDTNFSYGDPEGTTYGSGSNGQGYYLFVTPSSRSVVFNLKLGF